VTVSNQGVQLEQRGEVWIAALSRPDVLNAIDVAMIERLFELLAAAAAEPALRVLILTGTGRAFSSGRDLRELAAAAATNPQSERASIERLQTLTRRLVQHPKVVCAAVNGLAVGLGAELAVACDVRLAADTASFTFPEAQRGVFFTGGVLHLLPRLVGAGRTAHWLLTGSSVSAEEALRSGLVTCVVPADRLRDEALSFATAVAQAAPQSIDLLKQALRPTRDIDLEAMLTLEADGALSCLNSADALERLRAFVERRERS
jgi:enoyl-CoA hydratase/carnithine racemase